MSRILTILLLLFRARNYTGQERKFKDLKFIFVNGPDPNTFEYVELNETSKLLNHSNYDNDRPTMLYGYGYTEKYTSMSTQTVVSSYIERGDHNILVVEWSNYSGGNYLAQAIRNSYKVGEIVGKTLLEMQSSGFNLERFHLVGHSLGGHLVGYIGRSVKNNSNSTSQITRITALDPAGPLFYGYINYGSILNQPINKDDGLFVDVIHTDTTFFGAPDQCGDVDFWPNAGRDQPECPPGGWDVYNEENFCSHRRSWVYYSESVRAVGVKTFHSISCPSWENFTKNDCGPGNAVEALMSIDVDHGLTGNYYLQTNGQAPFNRGEEGTVYEAYK